TEVKKLEDVVKGMGARGLGSARLDPQSSSAGADAAWIQSPFAKVIAPALRQAVNQAAGAGPGDLLLFQFGKGKVVNTVLSSLRQHMGRKLEIIDTSAWRFLWVTDFPMFERSAEGQLVAAHHPFTSPRLDHVELLATAPDQVKARAYDLVLNGNEIAGGSIRIHEREVQSKVFAAMGLTE